MYIYYYRWPNGPPDPSPVLARSGPARHYTSKVDFRARPCRTTGSRWRPRHGNNAPRAVLARPEARQGPTAHQAHRARLCSNDRAAPTLLRWRCGSRRPAAVPGHDVDPAGLRPPRRKRKRPTRGLAMGEEAAVGARPGRGEEAAASAWPGPGGGGEAVGSTPGSGRRRGGWCGLAMTEEEAAGSAPGSGGRGGGQLGAKPWRRRRRPE
jgi:hypothetical protein